MCNLFYNAMGKRVFIYFILFFGIVSLAKSQTNQVETERGRSLKVMTYNLRFGELASLEQLAAFINEQNPDLVALQELDWMTERDRAPHQHHKDFITELGYRTGMFSLYGKTIPHANGLYGIGILTRKPYVNVRKVILPKAEGIKEWRALLMAEVELSDNDTIVFASTHLDYTSSEARVDQIHTITKELKASRFPVILGGDFNTVPDAPEIVTLLADWLPCSGESPTSPAKTPKRKIDYLFAYPQTSWQLESTKTIETQLSDHLPIVSEVTLVAGK